jgi:putative NIF3 family GTP cyclohydrolase 1 type 2
MEVIFMIDCTHKTIERLFFKQIKELTMKERMRSFERQFSDLWL